MVIFLVITLVLFIVVATTGPKPMDWSERYSQRTTSPFGGKLVFDRLPDLFPKGGVVAQNKRVMDFLKMSKWEGTNYMVVTKDFNPDGYEQEALLEYVAAGNNLFVAANGFSKAFSKELGFHCGSSMAGGLGEDVNIRFDQLIDPSETYYPLLRNIFYSDFGQFPNKEALSWNQADAAVFLRIPHGRGQVFVHSVPFIFSNYYLVDPDNYRYLSLALSVLPDQPSFWDEYYKPDRRQVDSPVRYVLLKPALRYAWILALVGVVLFILFRGKRRQRIIPIVAPPANTTLEFAATISMLYQARGSHKDMATKKIRFFFDYLRQRFKIATKDLSENSKAKIAARSGLPIDEVSRLIDKIRAADKQQEVSDIQFLDLCRVIDEFYRKTK